MTRVNFVYDTGSKTTKPTFYAHIKPIAKYLPKWSETNRVCLRDCVNVWITTSRRIPKILYYRIRDSKEDIIDKGTFDKEKELGLLEIGKKVNVFMSHGIADKNYRNYESIKDFDFVCTSGPLWTKKYLEQGVTRSRILEIGYPKLDPLFNGEIKPAPKTTDKIRVLWAPTHGGTHSGKPDLSSYPMCYNIAKKFPEDLQVKISPHPRHKNDKGVTLEDLLNCDVVISDTGSLVYEAWIMNKPVVFPTYLILRGVRREYKNKDNFEHQIFSNKLGYHASDPDELIKLIYEAYDKGLSPEVERFIQGILPNEYRGISGKMAAEAFSLIDIKKKTIFSIGLTSDYYATLIRAQGYDVGGVFFQLNEERPVSKAIYRRLKDNPLFKVRSEYREQSKRPEGTDSPNN